MVCTDPTLVYIAVLGSTIVAFIAIGVGAALLVKWMIP